MNQKNLNDREVKAAMIIGKCITFDRIREVDKPTMQTGWLGGIITSKYELFCKQGTEQNTFRRIVRVPELNGYFQLNAVKVK